MNRLNDLPPSPPPGEREKRENDQESRVDHSQYAAPFATASENKLTPAENELIDALDRVLSDRPDAHGYYVHHVWCNFDRRKSVTQARCNCPISKALVLPREHDAALWALFSRLEIALYGKDGNTWEANEAERLMNVLRAAVELGKSIDAVAGEGEVL